MRHCCFPVSPPVPDAWQHVEGTDLDLWTQGQGGQAHTSSLWEGSADCNCPLGSASPTRRVTRKAQQRPLDVSAQQRTRNPAPAPSVPAPSSPRCGPGRQEPRLLAERGGSSGPASTVHVH